MGHCGSVWAKSSNNIAVKREDGGPGRSLPNEYKIHCRILESLEDFTLDLNSQINLPACYGFLGPQDEAWTAILPELPPGYTSCNALLSERIPPMERESRQLLIDSYCPDSLKEKIATDKNNEDCLVRPYLGRRRTPGRMSRFSAFSLRNYPLHVDQMEELGLNLPKYARAMAESLAFMHWCARIDAKDIEFVLAPARSATTTSLSLDEDYIHEALSNYEAPLYDLKAPSLGSAPLFEDGQLGKHAMWILDFDCCHPITMDKIGVDQAVVAFYRDDPFYPTPKRENGVDTALWEIFREHYIITSHALLKDDGTMQKLPTLFIEKLVRRVNDFKGTPVGEH